MNKIDKIKKILKNENLYVILTEESGTVHGDAFEILTRIQALLTEIIESGFPKDLAKDIINIAFMSEEELNEKIEEETEKLKQHIDEFMKGVKNEHK
jgi:uncharacterized protein YqgV (UPF0045/DUF77 family)